MSTVNSVRPNLTSALAPLFASIEQDLIEVDRRLRIELQHSEPFIDELAQHSFRFGGKRLRPALLLLSAQAVGEVNNDHRTLAAVVEMIHSATLVHDDVLDEAVIRRHEDTINVRWNNQTSVLLGDYLFTHAFFLASSLDTTFGCRTIGRATNIVCEGELRQTASSGNFELSREEYLNIIEAKTAELCACCCRLGAHYADGDELVVGRLELFGRQLGVAFQIADDLLDLEGSELKTGKSLGTDLAKQKMTLPLILLRDQLDAHQQRELLLLLDVPNDGKTSALVKWLDDSGALRQAREVAVEYATRAADQLEGIAESPAKQALIQLAQATVSRCA